MCEHKPGTLEAVREFLFATVSIAVDVEESITGKVCGIECTAFDCDCAPVNYGDEWRVTVEFGEYGDKTTAAYDCVVSTTLGVTSLHADDDAYILIKK